MGRRLGGPGEALHHSEVIRTMRRTTARFLALAFGLAFPLLSLAGDVPQLWASYSVADVNKGVARTDMTFSFTLSNGGDGAVTITKIVLADPAMADKGYATFDGGTIPAGGNLKRSDSVSVPNEIVASWKKKGQPALFVYTKTAQGNVSQTRIDAVQGSK